MNNPYFKQTDPQYKLRWPAELRDKVAASAKAYNRSMNADIVARLEQSFLRESDFSPLNMPPEELKRRLENAKSELQSQKENPQELNVIVSSDGEDDENVVISKKFYNELMEIKGALRNLSLAVLNLEKHQYNLDDAVEEWKKDNL
ncbi:Arc family DNA-binding protein [Acinetobacter baumannii]|uniref:Arc family DNA-binding protein n=1 Tax=Acinetobacter baumannii TaxID=470 RepID=UPI0005FBC54E|nr:Arc family DNA-binding protein [Acinetobacter baumannii]MCZ3018423.1 Arc family DNA-binding protein [Acinetobacter baumannii]SSQ30151.1 phage regulatory protein [Acinetobacter baumannii]